MPLLEYSKARLASYRPQVESYSRQIHERVCSGSCT